MSMQDVAIGAHVVLDGKTYECVKISRSKAKIYDCQNCDLYDLPICEAVACTGYWRRDSEWVIFKAVKETSNERQ